MNDVVASEDKLSLLMFFTMSVSSFLSGNSWEFSAALELLLPSGLKDLWLLPALAWAGKCCSMRAGYVCHSGLWSYRKGVKSNVPYWVFLSARGHVFMHELYFCHVQGEVLWPFSFGEMKINCISTKGLMKQSIRGRELNLVILLVNSFNWKKKKKWGRKKTSWVMSLWGHYLLLALEMCSIFLCGPVLFALQLVDNPLLLFTESVGYDIEQYFIACSHEASTYVTFILIYLNLKNCQW